MVKNTEEICMNETTDTYYDPAYRSALIDDMIATLEYLRTPSIKSIKAWEKFEGQFERLWAAYSSDDFNTVEYTDEEYENTELA